MAYKHVVGIVVFSNDLNSRLGDAWLCARLRLAHARAADEIAHFLDESADDLAAQGLSPEEARRAADAFGFPVVVKADGLAGGKGVTVAADRDEADAAIRAAMLDGQFGSAGASLVIEECLTGPEVSFFVLTDGRDVRVLSTAQDHKRIWDGDRGPNTGGMGAFAPSPLMSPAMIESPCGNGVIGPNSIAESAITPSARTSIPPTSGAGSGELPTS